MGKLDENHDFAKSAIYGFPPPKKKNSGDPMAQNVQNTLLNDTQSSKVRLKNG